MLTFETVKSQADISEYINAGDHVLSVLGYTEHSYAHVGKVSSDAAYILRELDYDEKSIELVKIAGWMHDIGNMINRNDHAQSGALLSYSILGRLGASPEEISVIIGAIGNHDEGTGTAISPVSAALIIADKCDVRRTRVRTRTANFDIHDRVNYAVIKTELTLDKKKKQIHLSLRIDTEICSVIDYFEIFMTRMLMCRRAAEFLGLKFALDINDAVLM